MVCHRKFAGVQEALGPTMSQERISIIYKINYKPFGGLCMHYLYINEFASDMF